MKVNRRPVEQRHHRLSAGPNMTIFKPPTLDRSKWSRPPDQRQPYLEKDWIECPNLANTASQVIALTDQLILPS